MNGELILLSVFYFLAHMQGHALKGRGALLLFCLVDYESIGLIFQGFVLFCRRCKRTRAER
jgi:hypothetical protein